MLSGALAGEGYSGSAKLGGKESQPKCEAFMPASIEGDAEKSMVESSKNPRGPREKSPRNRCTQTKWRQIGTPAVTAMTS